MQQRHPHRLHARPANAAALQLVSMACLYLGGKVEDSPKSVRDVLIASCELRYRDQARRLSQDRVSGRGAYGRGHMGAPQLHGAGQRTFCLLAPTCPPARGHPRIRPSLPRPTARRCTSP
jgi:hypothetical protein